MGIIEILFIAIALAMDAFTVAMAVGLHLSCEGPVSGRQYFRLGFHFGLFQFLMPIIGWLAGTTIADYIQTFDHWVAFILLSYIGIKLIREGGKTDKYRCEDPTKGFSLIILSIATSIDALAMGLSLALLGTEIIYPSIIIGIVAVVFTLIGMKAGNKIGQHWRARVAWIGGIILIGIGLKTLLDHLLWQ
ncbi:MAG: manganese efflux pump [candidate division Zixibacteria bacterium]|nr:manganese efflux pump [candidate division Zixibacteria bacterium]